MRYFWRQLPFMASRLMLIAAIALTGIGVDVHSAQTQSVMQGVPKAPEPPTNAFDTNTDWRDRVPLDLPIDHPEHGLPRSGQRLTSASNALLAPPPLANIAKIAAGSQHTCALTITGAVKCWGSNAYGQLGNNDTLDTGAPVDVSGLGSGISAIAAGGFHTCALTALGAVKCWGYNSYGQLGNSSLVSSAVPVDVVGLGSGVTAISVGNIHTCARTNFGTAKCWGYNGFGQLGNNSTISSSAPVDVIGLGGGVSAITTGDYHTCALTNAGAVKCWGYNGLGQLGDNSTTSSNVPVDVTGLNSNTSEVSAGGYHTCARTSLSAVKCWGYNTYGQLGNNSTANSSVPADVIGLSNGITTISAGNHHACALTSSGALKCWGYNFYGELGNNSTINSGVPVDVNGLGSAVTAIAAGGYHVCALISGNTLKCWGSNSSGQLGAGWTANSPLPVNISGLGSATISVTAGGVHTCALTGAGAAKCWGYNRYGQLGNGDIANTTIPVDVSGLGSTMSAITAGTYHTCGLTNLGAAKCWGRNTEGQLGNNITTSSPLPVDVSGLGSGLSGLVAGGYHTCALTSGGGAKCWGFNGYGELGNNSIAQSNVPVDVTGLGSGTSAIAIGVFHTCALTSAGAVKCWGNNNYGQLGNNSNADSGIPVDVNGLGGGVLAIAAGTFHSCAIISTGDVKCWGYNYFGQLGNSTTLSSSMPTTVNELGGNIVAFAAGGYHVCALSSTGSTRCWGSNSSGQLGNSNNISNSLPVTVSGLGSGISAITAGNDHTCVRSNIGAIRCWGAGDSGQLGDGNAWKTTPVDVVSSSIPPSGPSQLFLPIMLAGYPVYFEGPVEQEPNNLPATANGPIRLNAIYTGHANDQSDYFFFNLSKSTTVAINLTGHNAEDAKCNQQPCLQVHLRDSQNTLLVYDFQKPYQIISPSLAAGVYYIRIFDASNGAYDSSNQYSLNISTP